MIEKKSFILIVEDDKPLRMVLTRYLQAVGYMVIQAASFHEALDKIAIKPNLMIVDIHLPDGTGWEVIDWLTSVTTAVPIIVMSGIDNPNMKHIQQVGAKAFLAKPFPIDALVSLVKQYATAA